MLAGLAGVLGQAAVTAVVNTGDDTVLHGLYISPDLDTVTYTLAGVANLATGWGLAGESWTTMSALARFERPGGPRASRLTWFNLGDKDIATHLYRTGRLAAGAPLSLVTAEVAAAFGVRTTLLPMTDDRVATRVTIKEQDLVGSLASDLGGLAPEPLPGNEDARTAPTPAGGQPAGGAAAGHGQAREIGFQEYFVGLRHDVPVTSTRFAGASSARPAPGVLDAISRADLVVICPSNPIVSIGPILSVPGVGEAVAARRGTTVAISPIVAGKALKGPADRLLAELGHEPSVVGVARLWAPYASTLVVDEADADLAPAVERAGVRCVVTRTVMSGPSEAAHLAGAVLGAAVLGPPAVGHGRPAGRCNRGGPTRVQEGDR